MERRALTLVELMAVLAILAVIGALAFPAVVNRLEAARFEAAGRGLEAAIVMGRAEAQRRGTPVVLVARAIGNEETGLFVEEIASDGGAGATSEGSRVPSGPSATPEAMAAGVSKGRATVGTPVVVVQGTKLSSQSPVAGALGEAGGKRAGEGRVSRAGGGAREQGESAVVVARFMPDGTAAGSGPVYLVGREAAAVYTVNRWTGSASVRAVDLTGAGEAGAEGATGRVGVSDAEPTEADVPPAEIRP